MQLRDYQINAAERAVELIKQGKIPYLAMEVRTGKTLTSFAVANMLQVKNVLFVTKLKAIMSVRNDYKRSDNNFELKIQNYESLHKVSGKWDLIIIDEAHSIGAFPKPSLRTTRLKKIIDGAYVLLLSGTPTPESYSQLYHQFWVGGNRSPFAAYSNFYKWAKDYVIKRERVIHGVKITDYSKVIMDKITPVINELFITVSQKEAGFEHEIFEKVLKIKLDENIKKLINYLVKDEIYTFKDGSIIICDTAVKKMNKIHQLCSGTIITDNKGTKILVRDKAEYIKENFKGKKIAIYYIFRAEGEIIKETFPNYTESPEEFNQSNNLVFISQIQSGSMGVNLSTADCIIFYNIHYSSLLYWQARARLQDKTRTKAEVYFIFTEGGIENKIYNIVLNKKDYTTRYFSLDYGTANTK